LYTVIGGLLKVNPADRLSFGQVFEVLVSIAESEGFSLKAQLPFKAASSPNVTGGPGFGIVNPLGSAAGNPQLSSGAPAPQQYLQQSQPAGASSGSLFSSLKGGAASLLKNIKEQSQQYLAPVGPPSSNPSNNVQAPSRTSTVPSAAPVSRPPPPRPQPPSPLIQRKEPGNGHIEFENREYEAMQHKHQVPLHRPAPPKPPPPKISSETAPPKIANLLDISFEVVENQGSNLSDNTTNQSSTNADLLGDLFSSSGSQGNNFAASSNSGTEDLLWGNNGQNNNGLRYNNKTEVNNRADVGDLLGDSSDPFASLLGKSVPNAMPSSKNPMDGFPAFGSSQPYLQVRKLLSLLMSNYFICLWFLTSWILF